MLQRRCPTWRRKVFAPVDVIKPWWISSSSPWDFCTLFLCATRTTGDRAFKARLHGKSSLEEKEAPAVKNLCCDKAGKAHLWLSPQCQGRLFAMFFFVGIQKKACENNSKWLAPDRVVFPSLPALRLRPHSRRPLQTWRRCTSRGSRTSSCLRRRKLHYWQRKQKQSQRRRRRRASRDPVSSCVLSGGETEAGEKIEAAAKIRGGAKDTFAASDKLKQQKIL